MALTTLRAGAFPSGAVLQTVQTVLTSSVDVGSIAQGAESGNISGFTRTITPSSTSNKVLVMIMLNVSQSVSNQNCIATLYRDNSKVSTSVGDSAGSRKQTTAGGQSAKDATRDMNTITIMFLDSASSTSELTYSVRLSHNEGASMNLYVNRTKDDNDANYANRNASTMVLQEIKG